ncbi:MAG: transglutaminase family protein [Caldilineaceae bacterium]
MPTYSVRHHTRYRYSTSISESVMEARMQPRKDEGQICHSFHLSISPQARVQTYADHFGNSVHWFTVPNRHGYLVLRADSLVEVSAWDVGSLSTAAASWQELDSFSRSSDLWDWMAPSHFARTTESLTDFAQAENIRREADPLSTLLMINQRIYDAFDYVPNSTAVDSPIDVALAHRRGVCQDYTHIFIALARGLGIPCRYASGYLYHQAEANDRSDEDASHAWAEALIPGLGWIGFDPTNHLIACGRHIRVAIGRDYADVPPAKGVFRGDADSELDVGVQVSLAERPEPEEELIPTTGWVPPEDVDAEQQQQMQQQQ